MSKQFPIEFTLENGTHVVITKNGDNSYDFTISPKEGPISHFNYRDDITFTHEMEEKLDFDQTNALRRFWLEQETEHLL